MMKAFAIGAALALLCLSTAALAKITIATVPVHDAGNAADTTGYGSVAYNYNIDKYEVTAGQYTAFLNAVAATDTYGLDTMSFSACGITRSGVSGSYTYSAADPNLPVVKVSFWDACRFANWLNNGQPTGLQDASTTETGAYTLNGYNGQDGRTIQRNPGAIWAVTSENEWYKAAYYKGGSINAGYWQYPTQSNSINTDMANYGNSVGCTTDVGSYPYPSAYGTFDQGGNVWEWNETVLSVDANGAPRAQRGGCDGYIGGVLNASYRNGSYYPANSDPVLGFRVVQLAVPEPSSVIVLGGGLISLMWRRRRSALRRDI